MGENGLSAADIAAINGGENGWGGMIWLFAILALMAVASAEAGAVIMAMLFKQM